MLNSTAHRPGNGRIEQQGDIVTNPIGQLTVADEGFTHQVVETFASVGTSDLAWTEKVCAMAAARDGSLQLGFGLGKYVNRDVIDSYGGISRGVEQITVRASRCLSSDPERTIIGPLRYEIIEPLRKIRFILEPNDCQPIAFDWLFEGTVAPQLRDHAPWCTKATGRQTSWYAGTRPGCAPVGSRLTGGELKSKPDTWVSTRDRSWGLRYDVGLPLTDVKPDDWFAEASFRFIWCPVYMERPDGSRYALFLRYEIFEAPGIQQQAPSRGGRARRRHVDRIVDVEFELAYDPANRRLSGGRLHCTMADGAHARCKSRSSPTPAFTSVPDSTSGSTATTTANGAAR